ncbi:hypothetical protein ABT168_23600 [Streptomyces sp. NPDC001793]|uniref:hypothetical protein n=1 Tax=Streptomyces sp. NPDC001793 TaxID=3154657 RepID=UPI00331AD22A
METEPQARRREAAPATGAVRPRLRGDVYFTATSDGTFVRSARGNSLSLLFEGASVHRLLTALAPALTGAATLEELLTDVPAPQRPSARQLIGTLLERGFARDAGSDLPHTLDDEEAERYAAQVQFIDCFADSAERRFQDFRAAGVVCVCGPEAARGFLGALTDCGTTRLTLVVPDSDAMLTIHQFATTLPEVPAELAFVPAPGTADGADAADWETLLGAADVVLHLADHPGVGDREAVARFCTRLGKPLVQGLAVADAVWIWPVRMPAAGAGGDPGAGAPDGDGGRSGDGDGATVQDGDGDAPWQRLLATRTEAERRALLAGPCPDELYRGPVPELAALQLAFRAFCHLTGVAMPELTAMARLDTATLEIDHHPVRTPRTPETSSRPGTPDAFRTPDAGSAGSHHSGGESERERPDRGRHPDGDRRPDGGRRCLSRSSSPSRRRR